ncbi:cell division protein SepF [Gordonia hankookensis]|uniref:Cell division protein SepF n=1 Tax=Gordonia hankookensis TaxID=589403 RepID=A0ABR7W5J0_9ACTN|nr:cell division protein SepF [Gordonia hankookensis]MBD1318094.1 cell division protein SepF [Gordonia hankookensis]NDZ95451.1 cell division protein SepF [Streptomyces sp. SID11726]NEB25719.1 cell division protein SepF [Streptomyces sp. SID6673]
MTTMQKFKAYFGMVPPGEYEDDYLEEPGGPMRAGRAYRDDYYGEPAYREPGFREGPRDADFAYVDDRRFPAEFDQQGFGGNGYDMNSYDGGGYEPVPEYAYAGGRHAGEPVERMRPQRLEPLQRSGMRAAGVPRPPMNADERELERVFADGPLQKITTLRPSDYGEARTIGERFRDGNPVIMDLVDMSNDDAKRLVDFAAGLAFALRGSFDKVATKVFLLSPADVDVSPEDRRKIAETGFYNHS